MLGSTFQHLKGIGSKKEQDLWQSGILSWDDLSFKKATQLSLFTENESEEISLLHASQQALKNKDANFFAQSLPRREYYRIALTFPDETMFLDIETTGLSRYYDAITLVGWNLGRKYNIYLKGETELPLQQALSQAKAIVTFNGSLFDIPFLRQEFPELTIPLTHIDLRFLSRRVGLAGGQKSIEKIIGVKREQNLQSLEGVDAPLLWYKYCRGDLDALKVLISYNHADIEGMKFIFDWAIASLIQKEKVPVIVHPIHQFSQDLTSLKISVKQEFINFNKTKISYQTCSQPSVLTFYNLADEFTSIGNLSKFRVVGIDLTGSENRASGWCLLEGDCASTKSLKTNAEIIRETVNAQPLLIAIDSPLSLPKGRLTVYDSDPGRKVYGITRSCERILKKRGINVYPSLIQSMQKLTERGIQLATHFRSLGIPVIEVYPGAAQDIMRIPRKQQGLEFLKQGLIDFGLQGAFQELSVSHDELDAITSAIVGIFFWSGKFEALGNEDEDYLIIPDLNASSLWKDRRAIGISGAIASGKTTAGQFLQSLGFHYTRFSLILAEILHERGLEDSRTALQEIGLEVNQELGQRWLEKELIKRIIKHGNVVIDGLRFPEDHAFLVERFGTSFLHIHLDLPQAIQLQRYLARGGTEDEFVKASAFPTEANISKLASLAHIVISDTSNLESVLSEIVQFNGKIYKDNKHI